MKQNMMQKPPPNMMVQQGQQPTQAPQQVMQGGIVNQQLGPSQADPMSALQNLASCQNFPSNDNQSTMIKTVHLSNMDGSNIIGVHGPTTIDVQMTGGMPQNQAVNQMQIASAGIHQVNPGVQMQKITANAVPNMHQVSSTQGTQIQMSPMNANGPMVQQRMPMGQNRMVINQMLIQQTNAPPNMAGPPAKRPMMAQMTRIRHAAPNMTIQPQMATVSDGNIYPTQVVHRPVNVQFAGNMNQQMTQPMPGHQLVMNQAPQMNSPHQSPAMNQMSVSVSPSSVSFAASPSQGLVPSPMSINMMGQRPPGSIPSVASPSPLNTPVMVPVPSPAARQMNDDQAYMEKCKQLSRFIEPLRARLEAGERENRPDLGKTRNLLKIISDPNSRVPMELLLKCETLLEKMDLGVHTAPQPTSSVPEQHLMQPQHPTGPQIRISEQNMAQPLLEALSNNIKKPFFSHTLYRTFGPALFALTNNDFKNLSPPEKKSTSTPRDIPEVLQGEVARLDQKFKIQLHPLQPPGSKTINLICHLDDQDLPCVPPISLKVPENYPSKPPQCFIDDEEYSASSTLSSIKKTFDDHMGKLPEIFSIMTLLNRWELSVRQATILI